MDTSSGYPADPEPGVVGALGLRHRLFPAAAAWSAATVLLVLQLILLLLLAVGDVGTGASV